MIYLLTAIGLTPGGSSTVHIYTQTVHRTTQTTQTIHRTTQFTNSAEEKARKSLSQGGRRVPVGRMKREYTEQCVRSNNNT